MKDSSLSRTLDRMSVATCLIRGDTLCDAMQTSVGLYCLVADYADDQSLLSDHYQIDSQIYIPFKLIKLHQRLETVLIEKSIPTTIGVHRCRSADLDISPLRVHQRYAESTCRNTWTTRTYSNIDISTACIDSFILFDEEGPPSSRSLGCDACRRSCLACYVVL